MVGLEKRLQAGCFLLRSLPLKVRRERASTRVAFGAVFFVKRRFCMRRNSGEHDRHQRKGANPSTAEVRRHLTTPTRKLLMHRLCAIDADRLIMIKAPRMPSIDQIGRAEPVDNAHRQSPVYRRDSRSRGLMFEGVASPAPARSRQCGQYLGALRLIAGCEHRPGSYDPDQ